MIGVGSIGCEWVWGQTVPIYLFPGLYLVALLGIVWVGIRAHSLQVVIGSDSKWLLLLTWFMFSVCAERSVACLASGHMPFDTLTFRAMGCYAMVAVVGLLGVTMGVHTEHSYRFLNSAARVLAVVSVIAFAFGSPPLGEVGVSPLLYVGFPVRLFCLFAFCWYLEQWLTGKRAWSWKLLGLLASSLPVVVAFHKPVIVSAIFSASVTLFLHYKRGVISRSLCRIALMMLTCLAVFTAVDTVQQGELSRRYLSRFYYSFLHTTELGAQDMGNADIMESAAGGRFELWGIVAQRFLDNPVLGIGIGQRVETSDEAIPVHNGYLDLLVSVGLFGTLPVVIGAVAFLRIARCRLKTQDYTWVSPVLAYTMGIGMYNAGGTSNLFVFVSAFLAFCLGLVVAPVRGVSMSSFESRESGCRSHSR